MKNTNTQEATVLPPPRPTLLSDLQCSAIIALCFLWTSTGYLSWMYHLLDFADSSCVDWLTEVMACLFSKPLCNKRISSNTPGSMRLSKRRFQTKDSHRRGILSSRLCTSLCSYAIVAVTVWWYSCRWRRGTAR